MADIFLKVDGKVIPVQSIDASISYDAEKRKPMAFEQKSYSGTLTGAKFSDVLQEEIEKQRKLERIEAANKRLNRYR